MIAIDQLADIRRVIAKAVAGVAPEDLFRVPAGFSNHVAWNAAHVVVTQQLLTYGLSGLELSVAPELVAKFRKGTGAHDAEMQSFEAVMQYFEKAPSDLAADYANGRFEGFNAYTTSAGIELGCVEDAITFNNFHEGIHLGYILALRKALAGSS